MQGKGRAKTAPSQIEAEERQAKAVNLRKAHIPYEDIAKELGYASASGAFAAVKAAMDKTLREPADELRQLELSRLDELGAVFLENALVGDTDAANTYLKILAQRARLLGLERKDSPIKVKLPKLEKAADAVAVVGALIEKVTAGEISPDDGGRIADLLGAFAKTAETAVLAESLEQFEELALASAERGKRK